MSEMENIIEGMQIEIDRLNTQVTQSSVSFLLLFLLLLHIFIYGILFW